jgi:hypothetical protein
LNRRNFLKTTALAASAGAGRQKRVFADSARDTTGFFGAHPFIEDHPEAVFILFTHVDVKTNADSNKKEGMKFAGEVIVPKDKTGIPVSSLVPIKPNVTGGGGNTLEDMGIITDPHFVEGVIEGMKNLGIAGKQFHIREVNCSNWDKHVYNPVARRTGADLRNTHGRVSSISQNGLPSWSTNPATIADDQLQWVDVPQGVVFRKIPYLWPINAPGAFFLNISKFKAHEMGMTLCCKNIQGAVGNGYQLFCWKLRSVMFLPPAHRNPDVKKDCEESFKRHVGVIPRWDRPINPDPASKDIRDEYDAFCQEVWSNRTLDNVSATKFGLCVVEGIYGRDGDFSIGPNPEGNENNPNGKAWDYMTNIIIFGKDPLRVDIVGKWLGGHEPGNFGLFHIAMERGMLNVLNPMNIPVYHWENGQAVQKSLAWFDRTPLKSFYLQRNYNGGTEPFWHLCNEPFDYSKVDEVKPVWPSQPGARILAAANQTASFSRVPIEYRVPEKGNVLLEILNEKGETVAIPVIAIRDRGVHLASWDTAAFDSGKYAYHFRCGDYSETREIVLRKS